MTEDIPKSNVKYKTESFTNFVQDDTIIKESRVSESKPFSQFKKNFSGFMSMDFASRSLDDTYDSVSVRSVRIIFAYGALHPPRYMSRTLNTCGSLKKN